MGLWFSRARNEIRKLTRGIGAVAEVVSSGFLRREDRAVVQKSENEVFGMDVSDDAESPRGVLDHRSSLVGKGRHHF